jgi:acid phosphatase type 7
MHRFLIYLLVVAIGSGGLLAACKSQPSIRAPVRESGGDPVLIVAGDIAQCDRDGSPGQGSKSTAALVEDLPGLVLTAGDNAYPRGSADDFQKCYEPTWGRFKSRTRPTPGNHEYYTRDALPYYAYFGDSAGRPGQGYYSLDYGNWHIVMIDSNVDGRAGSPQETWLREDLKKNGRNCILAVWHHPVFSSGGHGNDAAMGAIWRALQEAEGDVIVTGHDHHYERFAPQGWDAKADPVHGIREFVVGTGGAALSPIMVIKANSEVRSSGTFGVLRFVLHKTSYDWEFIPVEGQTFNDHGSATCHRH